ncbi:hypothetical protein [Micromonospora sp. NPDC005806]|uniref:hypothetical protein n=1 Tax=Micromonospora sp. NPDC005806 TaxID=3364234 RepID=UPI00368A7B49
MAAPLAVGFWYAASGLVAPADAVVGLLPVWLGLLAVAVRLMHRRPALVSLVPLSAALIWLAVVSAGGRWLGWTA